MVNPTQTGSFWLCPQCRKHVPSRQSTCKCGFDRQATPWKAEELHVGRATQQSDAEERTPWSLSRLGLAAGLGLLLAGSSYLAARNWLFPPEETRSALAAHYRKLGQTGSVVINIPGAPLPPSQRFDQLPETPAAAVAIPSEGDLSGLADDDRVKALEIARQLAEGLVSEAAVINAETVYRRNEKNPAVAQLLKATLLATIDRQRAARSFASARQILERARSLFPTDPTVATSSLRLLADMGDWPAAEALAQSVLATNPSSPDARRALALSLAGQGRDRDALRAIYSAIEVVRDSVDQPQLRELRDQIERRLWVTSGCETSQLPDLAREQDSLARGEKFLALAGGCVGGNVGQRLLHFTLGYQRLAPTILAESDRLRLMSIEITSRAFLPLLEEHYATLVERLGHQVAHPIPVVVLEDVEYRFSAGAPAWAGGQYDGDDKTITLPVFIAQRIEFKDPFAEQEWAAVKDFLVSMVLMHEVAHAFIDDATHGVAPRALHEGLAQFLEREVTRNRDDLAIRIEEATKERLRRAYPGASDSEVAVMSAKVLTLRLEEYRTADIKHAGTLRSTYEGNELFVEYLVKQRGMAGIQTLLRTMRETQSLDEAFDTVYGQTMDGTRRAWLDRLRQQWAASAPRRE